MGELVIVPRKSVNDLVLVQVMAGVDGSKGEDCAKSPRPSGLSCIEAKRLVHFISHLSFTLPIELDRSCVNVECPKDQTCVKGIRTSSDVPGKAAFGLDHSCVLAKGNVRCRGKCSAGQCGDATMTDVDGFFPVSLSNGDVPVAVVAGKVHSCALTQAGQIWCWGSSPVGPGASKPARVLLQ